MNFSRLLNCLLLALKLYSQPIILGYIFWYKGIAIKVYLIWKELVYNWRLCEREVKIIWYCCKVTTLLEYQRSAAVAWEGVLIIITRYRMVLCIFAPNLSGYQRRENTYLSICRIDLFFFRSPLRSFHNALLPTLGIIVSAQMVKHLSAMWETWVQSLD